MSLLGAEREVKQLEEDFGEDDQLVPSEQNKPQIQCIVDQLVNSGLKSASDLENDLMKARISAIIGKLLYKYMYTADDATKLIMLKSAK